MSLMEIFYASIVDNSRLKNRVEMFLHDVIYEFGLSAYFQMFAVTLSQWIRLVRIQTFDVRIAWTRRTTRSKDRQRPLPVNLQFYRDPRKKIECWTRVKLRVFPVWQIRNAAADNRVPSRAFLFAGWKNCRTVTHRYRRGLIKRHGASLVPRGQSSDQAIDKNGKQEKKEGNVQRFGCALSPRSCFLRILRHVGR